MLAAVIALLAWLPLHAVAGVRDTHPLVKVDVFVETLCPHCAHFLKEQLPLLFMNNVSSIVDLSIVPWGNAGMTDFGPVCQFGPVECQMNKKMSCFKHFHSDSAVLLQYAACSEGHSALDIDTAANECIKAMGLDLAEIQECEDGPLGEQLQTEAFNVTSSLQPPHLWVPWVVVNGQPIFSDVNNVQQYVCTAFTGTRPAACATEAAPDSSGAFTLVERQATVTQSLRTFGERWPTHTHMLT